LRLSKNGKIKIIALSQNQSDQFLKLTNRKLMELFIGELKIKKFENLGRDIDLLAVGSLIPLKNYSLFIWLIAELKKLIRI